VQVATHTEMEPSKKDVCTKAECGQKAEREEGSSVCRSQPTVIISADLNWWYCTN